MYLKIFELKQRSYKIERYGNDEPNTQSVATKNSQEKGRMVDYKVTNISDHMSFLEMLDVLNEQLIEKEKNL